MTKREIKKRYKYDVVIIGAGAAGMMCAANIEQTKKVAILEHNKVSGRKILVSGGGRCNFTNRCVDSSDYFSNNLHFCKSALSRYTPQDFIQLIDRHNIPYYEKEQGQLFCRRSSKDILSVLEGECKKRGVDFFFDLKDITVTCEDAHFITGNSNIAVHSSKLVIATGGQSFVQLGASDLGHRLAKQFGHKIIPPRPGLVPLKFTPFSLLSGISISPVTITVGTHRVTDDLLFTHRGLSGPAVLKVSLYWHKGEKIVIDWCPTINVRESMTEVQKGNMTVDKILQNYLPKRFVQFICQECSIDGKTKLAELSSDFVSRLERDIHSKEVAPTGTEGFKKAEVTVGGVDTNEISSQNMESKLRPDLYFIGEVLDVTGQLGGFNFHWAWASAHAAAQDL